MQLASGSLDDSHRLDSIVDELLVPFAMGAEHVLVEAYDGPSDATRRSHAAVDGPTILVFDGPADRGVESAGTASLDTVDPARRADIVIDDSDLHHLRIR